MKNQILRLTRPYMHGTAVKRIQEYLDVDPLDGIYGAQTAKAVMGFQRAKGLEVDGVVGPRTWKAFRGLDLSGGVPGEIFNLTAKHPRPKNYGYYRSWENITGVTLHQTGCDMPKSPNKWSRLNAHYGITREGLIVHVNDETDMIWHAQALSKKTIGIEIEGNFPGIIGDMSTLWKGGGSACRMTKQQLFASRVLFDYIADRFLRNGSVWRHVYAHRQSSDMRTADPGENIWGEVGIPWGNQLFLKNGETPDGGPGFKLGKGKPIPRDWDERRTAKYYG